MANSIVPVGYLRVRIRSIAPFERVRIYPNRDQARALRDCVDSDDGLDPG